MTPRPCTSRSKTRHPCMARRWRERSRAESDMRIMKMFASAGMALLIGNAAVAQRYCR